MKKKEYKKRIEKEKNERRKLDDMSMNKSVKTGLIIGVSVLAFVLLMFVFTKIKTGEWNLFTKENKIIYTAEIQSSKILCGSILNRDSEEYFVLAYSFSNDDASLYESLTGLFDNSTRKIPLYKVDLSNSRNNICKGDLNITNNINELKLSIPTLIKVKNAQITESYTDYNSIKNVLKSYVD